MRCWTNKFSGHLDAFWCPKTAVLTCLVAFKAVILVILLVVLQSVFAAELYLVDALSLNVTFPFSLLDSEEPS